NNVPAPVKILMSLLVAMICFTIIKPGDYPSVTHYQTIIGLSIKEMIIGVAMGFLTNLIFHAVSMAGELISMAMGLSSSQLYNPALNVQQSSVNQLYFYLAALLFLVIRGHHYFIMGLAESYKLIPLNVILPRLSEMGEFAMLGQKILEVGFMLAAPVMVSILLVNFSLGIMGRAVPQINVLITSLPVNALMGFGVLIVVLPFFMDSLKTEIIDFTEILFGFLKVY
ncbi:MAG: flagellar biosynthetic protein FliR, partial [Bdellovibrionales bacterium]|nr:flagellar biosynthetic protein FliR [Bdellovibrionales bacterium]NQZ19748.1 flagellar biosynthetic protein FliR [Bdellovibrionales bacterium]